MPRMTIEFSTEHAALIENEINSGRASTRNEAMAAIIRQAVRFRELEELGRLAKEGIESGEPIPVTPAYWQKKKRAIDARQRARAK